MDYFFGAVIGALIVTFLITRIINRILKDKFNRKKSLVISFFISAILIVAVSSMRFGIPKSVFTYVPFLLLWLIRVC